MRWLVLLFLWVTAVVLAILILRRVRRGKPVVLAGRWSPRLVRMIAVVLVVVGAGEQATSPEAAAAPAKLPVRPADDELPKAITVHTVQVWLAVNKENGTYSPDKRTLARALAGQKLADEQTREANLYVRRLPKPMQKVIRADFPTLDERTAGLPSYADLIAALDSLEAGGWYDHFWNGYLWRKTASATMEPAQRIELFARFRQNARITDALIRAHAQVKPLMEPPRAWMSKAGPKKQELAAVGAYQASLTDMIKVANEALPTTDEGTWKRDAILLVRPVKDSPAPILIRGGRERALSADESTRFGRLDLLKTSDQPATIVHDWLGKIELPKSQLISAWELPKHLSDAARQKLDEAVLDALKNNSEDAAERLERCLPLSHHAIRAGLKELPNAKGAPRLRLILSLFDDAVMPALPSYGVGESMQELGDRRGGR